MKKDYLTPLTRAPKSKNFLVLDLESKDDDTQVAGFTRPFMGGACDGPSIEHYTAFFDQNPNVPWDSRFYEPGGCVDRLMRHILRACYAGWHIYAHNGGRFDYLFVLPWLMKTGIAYGFKFEIVPVASSIQMLKVWHGKKRNRVWTFLDSYKLIPLSLDKAAKTFGFEGKKSHDLNLDEKDPRWVEYNAADCLQLYLVVEKFHSYIENVLMGEVGVTAPATAMKLYRRKYLREDIPREQATHEFIREGYFGGRTDPLERSGSDLFYFDINSSYPNAMLADMPAGHAQEWQGEPTERLTKHRLGWVRADVYVPEQNITVLPVKHQGKLIFPCGKLRGVWSYDELMLAVSEGATVERFYESHWYEKRPIFSEFVRDLYRYRQKCDFCASKKFFQSGLQKCPECGFDEGLATIAKLLLNASYGKFGMKTLRRKIYLWNDKKLPKNAVPANGDPECMIWYAEEEIDACYIIPQIAARVTSLARMRLYHFMRMAENLGGRVYYCDTDSIITDVELPTSNELGELKNEIPGLKLKGEFLGPKLYVLSADDGSDQGFLKVKAKGFERATLADIRKMQKGEPMVINRLEKIGALAQDNFQRGPRMKQVPKRLLASENDKRIFLPNGRSRPIYLDQWAEAQAAE